jgi:hypothetical protein
VEPDGGEFSRVGAALDGPVWQTITPEVVPRKELPAAVTLGGLSFNLAKAAGPAVRAEGRGSARPPSS